LFEEYERKKIKEQEQEYIRINVDNLKEKVRDYIENQIAVGGESTDSLKELQNKLSTTARESVRARRMQGWISLVNHKILFNKDDFVISTDNENGKLKQAIAFYPQYSLFFYLALNDPLLKNTLRVFLSTISTRLESDHPVHKIYKNLMLDKYQDLQELNSALDQATVQDATLRDHASRLLHTVLNEPYV
jgi:hypothetical protein